MNVRKIGYILSGLLFFSSLIFLFSFNTVFTSNFSNKSYSNEDVEVRDNFNLRLSNSPLFEFSGVGQAQNVSEYGRAYFPNNGLYLDNNDNASIKVPNDWSAKQILCNVTRIYENDKLWMNETFDTGIDFLSWSNHTDNGYEDYINYGWYDAPSGSNDSIYLALYHLPAGDWYGVDSYLNYTFNLDREEIPNTEWEINFKYRFMCENETWLSGFTGGSYVFCRILVDGISREFSLGKPSDHVRNAWYSDTILPFNPYLYNLNPPGEMNILFGIATKRNENPNGNLTFYVDNITLNIPNIPRPTQINLSMIDITHGTTGQFSDIPGKYGLGTISLYNDWAGIVGGATHEFLFSSNSSGSINIDTDIFVSAKSSRKTYTELGTEGSEFLVKNDTYTLWKMYFPVSIPGSYSSDYYFNFTKPLNWNITEVIDPYLNNKVNDVIGAGYGNTTVIIPNHIITNGLWEFVAEAPNYVKGVDIYKNNGIEWNKNSTFQINDKLKINASIATELISDITLTKGYLQIFYPNGTLFYAENAS
ncbi:MAG: hypothetical protein ACFFDY_11530, partial [Candidatus Thorarchaeota archaeon]